MTKRNKTRSQESAPKAAQHPASLPSWAWTAGSLLLAASLATVWLFEKKPAEAMPQAEAQVSQASVAAPEMAAKPVSAQKPRQEAQVPAANLAPDFSRPEVNSGKPVKLSAYRGKVVIVDFWATWCGPCRMEIPHFVELQKQYKEKGFTFIGVSLDQQGPGVVKQFMTQWNINYPMVMDMEGALAQNYGGIRGIPTTFIVGKKGDIKETFVGYRPKEVFEEAIKKALAEI